jgi:heat shock protein HtpX
VTAGLVRDARAAELDAVLAHELAHISHGDVAVMTVAGVVGRRSRLASRKVAGDDQHPGDLVAVVDDVSGWSPRRSMLLWGMVAMLALVAHLPLRALRAIASSPPTVTPRECSASRASLQPRSPASTLSTAAYRTATCAPHRWRGSRSSRRRAGGDLVDTHPTLGTRLDALTSLQR